MRMSLLAAALIAAIAHGEAVAQTITLGTDSKMGRSLICRDKWKALQAKANKSPQELQAIEYGSQYFAKLCKRDLEANQAKR